MEATEVTKMIDGVYKNILESFNPASRQMITTGKAYLKSLHGASAASSLYLDTLVRMSRQAQQSALGNSGDIGACLMQITEVFKEIHAQQLNTLKAFYVDFLVPLESNLEQDTRVIQTEQKKFMVNHKQRIESFNKAASTMKKIRKKSKKSNPSAATLDKEIKVMQNMEEERAKLEAFCDKSIKEALTQERRRYGFILERQASLAKHYLAFYSKGSSHLSAKLDSWLNVAKTRETLPECVQSSLIKRIQGGSDTEQCIYCNPRKDDCCDDAASVCSQLRKTKSMDAAEILNLQSSNADMDLHSGPSSISRAKSEINLAGSGQCGGNCGYNENCQPSAHIAARPKSLAVATESTTNGYAKALYAYLSSGDNQLSFLEGDILGLIGDRNKGWQFGENLRTQKTGWFPIAYTEMTVDAGPKVVNKVETPTGSSVPPVPPVAPLPPSVISMNNMNLQQSQRLAHSHGTYSPTSSSDSSLTTFQQRRLNIADVIVHRTPESMRSHPNTPSAGKVTSPGMQEMPVSNNNLSVPSGRSHGHRGDSKMALPGGRYGQTPQCASDSLHSSNDSGISNDCGRRGYQPPQPDIDYSDDDSQLHNSMRQRRIEGENTPPATGDAWLMERYHMSESIRVGGLGIGGITRRRSLSFSNVSGVGVSMNPQQNNTNGRSSPRGRSEVPHSQANIRGQRRIESANGLHRRDTSLGIGKEDPGAIKKFLNRTKSLIWRRNLDRIDSISFVGSMNSVELWRSHASLIDTSCELVELSDKGRNSCKNIDNDNDTIVDEIQHDVSTKVMDDGRRPVEASNEPPPLPPFPPGLVEKTGWKRNPRQINKATSTTSSLQDLSLISGDDTLERGRNGPLDNESCIFISDHAKSKGSQRSGHRSIKSSVVSSDMRVSKKIQTSDSYNGRAVANGKRNDNRELIYDIETPIVPVEMNVVKVKRKTTNGFDQLESREPSTNGHHTSSGAINGSKAGKRSGRREKNFETETMSSAGYEKSMKSGKNYSSDKNPRKYMYSDDEKEAELDVDEYDVDEEMIDFDDDENGIYEDNDVENASSVFIHEAELDEVTIPDLDGSQSYTASMQSRTNGRINGDAQNYNLDDMMEMSLEKSKKKSRSKPTGPSTNGDQAYMNGANGHSHSIIPAAKINGHKDSRQENGRRERDRDTVSKQERKLPQDYRNEAPEKLDSRPNKYFDSQNRRSESNKQNSRKSSKANGKESSRSRSSNNESRAYEKNLQDYSAQIHRRLYYPERTSRLDQKSERSGNLCGPWYDLWGEEAPVVCK